MIFRLKSFTSNKSKNSILAFTVFLLSAITLWLKARSEAISPFDEMYHLSYIQYVFQGQIPRYGQALNSWSMNGFSCHPVFPFGNVTAVPCGEIGIPAQYPEGGTNSAQGWPPGYYAAAAAILHLTSLFNIDPFYAARGVSVFLWSFGCAALFLMQTKANISRMVSFGVAIVVASLPLAMFHGAYTTPHSTAPLMVAIASWGVFKELNNLAPSPRKIWRVTLIPLCVLVVLPHALPVVLASSLFFIIILFKSQRQASREAKILESISLELVGIAVAASTIFGWAKIQQLRLIPYENGIESSAAQVANNPEFNLAQFFDTLLKFVPHAIDAYQFQSTSGIFISTIWSYIAMAVITFLIFQNSNKNHRIFGTCILVSGIFYSFLAELFGPVAVPPRYGISIAILVIVSTGLIAKDRIGRTIVISVSWVTYGGCVLLSAFN